MRSFNKYPENIDIETISTCNRVCPTCIRNSHPKRDKLASWFEKNLLPYETIEQIFVQAKEWGFNGNVWLSHFNEPLMDERIVDIIKLSKSFGFMTGLNSNGDFLSEELAKNLDGNLDKIIVSLYMPEPKKSERAEWINTLFRKTELVISMGVHIPSHFSPDWDVSALANKYKENNCLEPRNHLIINHKSQYLLCCEDVIGNFNLGKFPDIPLQAYWEQGKRRFLQEKLDNVDGRGVHSYCLSCPKP